MQFVFYWLIIFFSSQYLAYLVCLFMCSPYQYVAVNVSRVWLAKGMKEYESIFEYLIDSPTTGLGFQLHVILFTPMVYFYFYVCFDRCMCIYIYMSVCVFSVQLTEQIRSYLHLYLPGCEGLLSLTRTHPYLCWLG